MAAQRFINIVSGKLKQIVASATGTVDAIPAGDSTGRLDISWMPVGVGAEVVVAPASENLAAGDFVNLWLNGGVINVRKADATTNAKPAHGFVLAAVTSPANATVYFESNTNTQRSGLTIGSDYFLDTTAGGITTTPPSSAGNIVQFIGRAQTATAINFINGDTIEVA
jgi:hypothetical protein